MAHVNTLMALKLNNSFHTQSNGVQALSLFSNLSLTIDSLLARPREILYSPSIH